MKVMESATAYATAGRAAAATHHAWHLWGKGTSPGSEWRFLIDWLSLVPLVAFILVNLEVVLLYSVLLLVNLVWF